ncbi:MAG: carbohydrate binding family 9 domain-containing protein [Bacteroidales bacterium]|nr:carbohydrate binding family 9 domain-containing protein [Bacteroidales bacterium]
MKKLILFLILFALAFDGFTQEIERRTYQTNYTKIAPVIDGLMNDACWNLVEWSGNFTQTQPYENKPPTQQTSFKILYDDNNLYVFIRADDTEADKISRILTRRDDFSGDMVEINIDSYYDKQTAFSFTAMASGAKGDEAVSLDGNNWDSSWNPVWTLKTSIDNKGWSAEMSIPLTQLRFGNKEEHVWGIQLMRHIYRDQERSNWQFIPKGSPGMVHLFGELHGIKNIRPKRQVEIMPYMVAKTETFEKEEGNPFANGKSSKITAGVDGKIGLTNDFTLDFTVNPDFGQVEADPSEVNLTAFESYFSEQRPFFVEGKNIYQFRPNNPIVISTIGQDNLFYSRRIGRYPQYYPETVAGEYVKMPEATTILAAFKLSGKTKKGLSIGVLESTTANEKAEIDNNGARRKESVEPLTNYFVARLQQDFNKGETVLGGIFTAVNRDITNPAMNYLHNEAYAGGIDFKHSWKERIYYISATTTFSNVRGDKNAITATQTSSARYYQRPDAKHLSVDSSLTSLSGYGGSLKFGRQGQKKVQFETSVNFKSPGLEFNDIGYMRYSNIIHHGTWVGYYLREPFSIFRNLFVNMNYWMHWNFDGDLLSTNAYLNFNAQFKNKWRINGSMSRQNQSLSTTLLRGGPSIILPGSWDMNLNISTDYSKKVSCFIGVYHRIGDSNLYRNNDFWAELDFRPVNSVSISLAPDFYIGKDELQYLVTTDYKGDPRYIFAQIDQKTLGITFRLDYTLTPDLSIQYYGQPFISSGKYSNYKRITQPHAALLHDRYSIFSSNQLALNTVDGIYDFDEDLDGTTDYSISLPNFNVREFRSNLVVRWEYRRGSTIFFVWSQGRSSSDTNGNFSYRNDMQDLFGTKAHNVFLIKFNYWFSR